MPEVSVILPVYGESRYLAESIKSVLLQSLKSLELIVIEDPKDGKFGNEGTIKTFQDSRIKYVKNQSRLGLVNSLNKAISVSKSKYIARQDADDVSFPDRLLKQLEFIQQKKATVVGGNMEIIDESGVVQRHRNYPQDHETIKKKILLRDPIAHPTVMFDKKIISDLGGYDPKMLHVEDYDLWMRVINAGFKVYNLPDYLIQYRHHKDTIKYKNFKESVRGTIHLQKKAIREYKNLPVPKIFPIYLLAEYAALVPPSKLDYFLFEKIFVR